jgi:F0F1-type ATP synthase delta subunit
MNRSNYIVYAKALAEALSGKMTPAKEAAMVENMAALLKKDRQLGRAEKILKAAERFLLKKNGRRHIVLETARAIDTKALVRRVAGRGDKVQEKIKPELVAGVRIVIDGERQLDLSLQRMLEELFL